MASVSVEQLHGFAERVFEALGMTTEHAGLMADHIAWAHARGYPWLGAKKIIQYGTRLQQGVTAPTGEPEIISERAGFILYDAHDTFSQVSGTRAMRRALEKAGQHGSCSAVVRNTTSATSLGLYAEMAAGAGMIGLAINNAPPLMPVHGGATKLIGNQAFAIGCPAGRHDPLIFDSALSKITLVGIHGYEQRGEELPAGLALDSAGRPTTDPSAALAGMLVPIAEHRGSGLALMWEILTGVLSGSERFLTDVTMPGVFDRSQAISMFFLVIDPRVVMPLEEFTARVDTLIDSVHASAPAEGFERVRVPGESGAERGRRSNTEGIDVDDALVEDLRSFGRAVGVAWS